MPAVIAGAAIAGAVSAATALPWLAGAAFLKAFAVSLLLGGLNYALAPKPKKASGISNISQNTVSSRQAVEPHKHIYGHTRAAGVYAHMTTVGEGSNKEFHAFLVVAASKITAFKEIWVNDYSIPVDWLDSNGLVTQGTYANKLRIRLHLGDPDQSADSVAVAEIPEWTSNHRLRGRAYAYLTLYKDQDVYPSGFPNFTAVVTGKPIYDPRTANTVFTPNACLFSYDYLSLAPYGFKALTVSTTNVSANASICDEIVATSSVDMVIDSIDTDTDIITLTGDRLLFEYGDRVEVVTAGSAPSGLATSTSYYVIPVQMKDTPRIQLATTLANSLADTAIDITSTGSGSITIRKTGEPRYHGAGILDTGETLDSNLGSLLLAMAGRAVHSGQYWKLLAGAWRTPSLELTLTDQRGGIDFQTAIELSEKFNSVSGIFVSSLNNYQAADFPAAKYQAFIDADNGVEYPAEPMRLLFTNRPTTAQRIAKIELFKSRQTIVFNSSFTMKAYQAEAGDNILLSIAEFGFEEKAFEVTAVGLDISSGGILQTQLALRETTEAIFDWSAGEAISFDPAPNTTLPNPFTVQAVTGFSYSSREVETAEGDLVFALIGMWDEHVNGFVTQGGFIETQYRLSTDTEWSPGPLLTGDQVSGEFVVSSVNISYDMRVRARNNLGRRSAWTTITGAIVGYSGGVTTTEDYGSVADSVGTSLDYGSVADSPSTSLDYGSVT